MDVFELRAATGCGLAQCKSAIEYAAAHGAGDEMALAYLKAKNCAVKTTGSFDERVVRFMKTLHRAMEAESEK